MIKKIVLIFFFLQVSLAQENDSSLENILYRSYVEIDIIENNERRTTKLVNEAVDYNTVGQYSKAAPLLEQAYKYSGELDYIYYAAGSYVNAKDYDNALRNYIFLAIKKYDIENRDKEIYKNISLIAILMENYLLAQNALRKASELNPTDIDLILNEADLYIKLINQTNDLDDRNYYLDKFKEIMFMAIDLDPTNGILHYNLGFVNQENNEFEVAEYHYKKAIELEPNYISSYLNLVTIILFNEKNIIDEINSLGKSKEDKIKIENLTKMIKDLYIECIPYLEKANQIDPYNQEVITRLNDMNELLSN